MNDSEKSAVDDYVISVRKREVSRLRQERLSAGQADDIVQEALTRSLSTYRSFAYHYLQALKRCLSAVNRLRNTRPLPQTRQAQLSLRSILGQAMVVQLESQISASMTTAEFLDFVRGKLRSTREQLKSTKVRNALDCTQPAVWMLPYGQLAAPTQAEIDSWLMSIVSPRLDRITPQLDAAKEDFDPTRPYVFWLRGMIEYVTLEHWRLLNGLARIEVDDGTAIEVPAKPAPRFLIELLNRLAEPRHRLAILLVDALDHRPRTLACAWVSGTTPSVSGATPGENAVARVLLETLIDGSPKSADEYRRKRKELAGSNDQEGRVALLKKVEGTVRQVLDRARKAYRRELFLAPEMSAVDKVAILLFEVYRTNISIAGEKDQGRAPMGKKRGLMEWMDALRGNDAEARSQALKWCERMGGSLEPPLESARFLKALLTDEIMGATDDGLSGRAGWGSDKIDIHVWLNSHLDALEKRFDALEKRARRVVQMRLRRLEDRS